MTAVDDALDRLNAWPHTDEDISTVRDELRLRKQIASGYAKENSRLEAELQRLREERTWWRKDSMVKLRRAEAAEERVRQLKDGLREMSETLQNARLILIDEGFGTDTTDAALTRARALLAADEVKP